MVWMFPRCVSFHGSATHQVQAFTKCDNRRNNFMKEVNACALFQPLQRWLQLRPLYFLLDNSVKVQLQDDRKAKISGDLNPEIRKQTTGMCFFSRVCRLTCGQRQRGHTPPRPRRQGTHERTGGFVKYNRKSIVSEANFFYLWNKSCLLCNTSLCNLRSQPKPSRVVSS